MSFNHFLFFSKLSFAIINISFKALKEKYERPDEKFFLTMIIDHDPINVERYEPDFSTTDEISDSIERLISLF